MPRLTQLKSATSLADIAGLLGFSAAGLSYVLYKQSDSEKYEKFKIKKKDGSDREISAPKGALKAIQRALADLLNDCRDEIYIQSPRKPLSHGFRRPLPNINFSKPTSTETKVLSIVTNAKHHRRKRYVLNIDIEDFFPSFNFGRVRGFFLKDQDFQLNEKVATVIAQIACCENSLPQGSPCSPVISDMIAHILDRRLVQFSKIHRVEYSRYADDITFSTNEKIFPPGLASQDPENTSQWLLSAQLIKEFERLGFRINNAKTRLQLKPSRQVVTGLTVNDKVNIRQTYWRGARSMCHSLFMTGEYRKPRSIIKGQEEPETIKSLDVLAGILSHIYYVKKESGYTPEDNKPEVVYGQALHQKFWFYKIFVALDRPLVITEGETDPIYIRNAIAHLTAHHAKLLDTSGEKNTPITSFFNYHNKAKKFVGLTGGYGPMSAFIFSYRKNLRHYKHKPLRHPVIMLYDNDSAINKLPASLKKSFGVNLSLTTTDDFYHLTDNLYLVKTPELGGDGTSSIEDFFEKEVLELELSGKTFHPDKDGFDPDKHFGKVPFAKKVVVPAAATIKWDGFSTLLNRISAVLDHYVAPTDPDIKPAE